MHSLNISNEFIITIYSLQGDNEIIAKRIKSSGIKLIELNLNKKNIILSLIKLFIQIYLIKPNQIHGWMYHGNLVAFVASLFLKKTTLVFNIRQSFHSFKQEKKSTGIIIILNTLLSYLADFVIYNSNEGLISHKSIGFNNLNSIYIPNGVDTNIFYPCLRKRSEFRKTFSLSENVYIICLLARYDPIKGHRYFLEAAEILLKQKPNVLFLVAGKNSYKILKKYRNIVEKISENLLVLDHQNDSSFVLNGIDILTVTSLSEGFPNVLAEAMAVGKVCLSTRAGDASLILGNDDLIISNSEPFVIAQKWLEIILKSPSFKKEISLYSIKRIKDIYNQEVFLNKYTHVLSL